MWCTNCGQAIAEGAAFCRACGTPAQVAAAETTPPPAETAPSTDAAPPTDATPPPAAPSPTEVRPPAAPQAPVSAPVAAAAPPQPPPPPPPPTAQGGYGGYQQPPQGPPPGRSRTGIIIGSVVAAVVILAGLGVGLFFGLRGDDTTASDGPTKMSAVSTTSTTEKSFTQAEGEIFLEAVGTAGPESFTGELFVSKGPQISFNLPETLTEGPDGWLFGDDPYDDDLYDDDMFDGEDFLPEGPSDPGDAGMTYVASMSGDHRALYGGSMSTSLVDKQAQLDFFVKHPAEAAAFCAALNSDPTLLWGGGDKVEPAQLPDYFAELTPLMLIHDTRVTNHGFRDGKPTPRQAVLQKGQMVLVDAYGVPRVRCECGNPLIPPKPVTTAPVYTGPKWSDFDPTIIIVVEPAPVIIDIFVTVDVVTADIFSRPVGTDGKEDDFALPMVWDFAMDLDWFGYWQTEIWIGPVGTVMGGEWVFSPVWGNTFDDSGKTGEWWAEVSFDFSITGRIEEVEGGRVLFLQLSATDLDIDNLDFDTTGDVDELRAGLLDNLPEWLESAMVPLEIEVYDWYPAEVSFEFAAEMAYPGTVMLTPLQ